MPLWVKQGTDTWLIAAGIESGPLLRRVTKSGKVGGFELGAWAVWAVVEQAARQIGIEQFGAHDLR